MLKKPAAHGDRETLLDYEDMKDPNDSMDDEIELDDLISNNQFRLDYLRLAQKKAEKIGQDDKRDYFLLFFDRFKELPVFSNKALARLNQSKQSTDIEDLLRLNTESTCEDLSVIGNHIQKTDFSSLSAHNTFTTSSLQEELSQLEEYISEHNNNNITKALQPNGFVLKLLKRLHSVSGSALRPFCVGILNAIPTEQRQNTNTNTNTDTITEQKTNTEKMKKTHKLPHSQTYQKKTEKENAKPIKDSSNTKPIRDSSIAFEIVMRKIELRLLTMLEHNTQLILTANECVLLSSFIHEKVEQRLPLDSHLKGLINQTIHNHCGQSLVEAKQQIIDAIRALLSTETLNKQTKLPILTEETLKKFSTEGNARVKANARKHSLSAFSQQTLNGSEEDMKIFDSEQSETHKVSQKSINSAQNLCTEIEDFLSRSNREEIKNEKKKEKNKNDEDKALNEDEEEEEEGSH